MILMFLYKIIIKLFVGKTIWSNQFGVKYDFNEIDPQNKYKTKSQYRTIANSKLIDRIRSDH